MDGMMAEKLHASGLIRLIPEKRFLGFDLVVELVHAQAMVG